MKGFIASLTLVFYCSTCLQAQMPDWDWATAQGRAGDETGQSIALDAVGNVYVAGSFSSDTLFIDDDTLVNNGVGNFDIFVMKQDVWGNAVWGLSFGGSDVDYGTGISIDAGGNVYITGWFSSDSLVTGAETLINPMPTERQMFLIKCDSNGNVVWARDFGGVDLEEGHDVGVDVFGNVYVTGVFRSSGITFGSSTLVPLSSGDVYLAKYDSDGNEIWARTAGGSIYQEGEAVDFDMWGNVYITGRSYGPSLAFGSIVLNSFGQMDGFIAKYDSAGNEMWATGFGGALDEEFKAIAVDDSGYIHVTGTFASPTIMFGSFALLNPTNTDNMFVARFDSAGTVLWAVPAGGLGNDGGGSVSLDDTGNVYVIGYFNSVLLDMGGLDTLTSAGDYDIFLVKYNSGGTLQWASGIGSIYNEYGMAIATDMEGTIYCTGVFTNSSLSFDAETVNNQGLLDVFVAKTVPSTASVKGIKNIASSLNIYPNPSAASFTVELPADARDIEILNVAGQQVLKEQVKGRHIAWYSLDVPGMYFVRVYTDNAAVSGKVLIGK